MALVRVILLSQIVFTVTSAACCGEEKDQCQYDCTGIVCTDDDQCDDQCCVGDSFLYKGYCGACHKTRHCQYFRGFGRFCHEKCCGSGDFNLQCLESCDGISCEQDDHCDGECCIGDAGGKTCGPCPKPSTPPSCTHNLDCPTNCCKFGTCFPRKRCPSPTRPSTPQPTTTRRCTLNFDCITNCCKNGSCARKEMCVSTASESSSSVDLTKVIAIPIAVIIFLTALVRVLYVCLNGGHKGTSHAGASQSTSHPAPPTVDNGAGPVTYYKVGHDDGNSNCVTLYVVEGPTQTLEGSKWSSSDVFKPCYYFITFFARAKI